MHSRKGFTLIELLVVISIVALLSSVVLSSVNTARTRARVSAGKQFSSQVDRVAGDMAEALVDFNECSGTSAVNTAGSGNNATLTTSSWSTDAPASFGCSFSATAGGYAYLSDPSVASYANEPFTVSVWVKQSVNQSRAGMVSTAHYQNGGYMLGVGTSASNARPAFEINGSGTSCLIEGPSNMPLGEWVSLVAVYTGSTMHLYQNGTQVATGACASISANTYGLTIGRTFQGGWGVFTGLLDNVHVFSKTLTASEVRDRYLADRAGRAVALVE